MIMKEIFQPDTDRGTNNCYADYVNKGGTLHQIHSWLNSLNAKGRKKIKIYIHPGVISLSSHLVEYTTKSDVLVITPKYATAPAPNRLSLVIKQDHDLDAWKAITSPLDSMSQPVNKQIEKLFREFKINSNAI
ncbi:unnamed protein product [marine sediment metagenome]|uniref:Uncharacterized protein n=1 Tax=marine sediment metagenome TaxID=412755 RepID=X0SVT2_9ZZZZ